MIYSISGLFLTNSWIIYFPNPLFCWQTQDRKNKSLFLVQGALYNLFFFSWASCCRPFSCFLSWQSLLLHCSSQSFCWPLPLKSPQLREDLSISASHSWKLWMWMKAPLTPLRPLLPAGTETTSYHLPVTKALCRDRVLLFSVHSRTLSSTPVLWQTWMCAWIYYWPTHYSSSCPLLWHFNDFHLSKYGWEFLLFHMRLDLMGGGISRAGNEPALPSELNN